MSRNIFDFLGIEIGGTKLQIVIGDQGLKIRKRFRFAVSRDEGAEGIRKHIDQTLKQIFPENKIGGIGIGFGGPVDWETGKIACSHQIEGWSGFSIREWFQSIAYVPVYVDNDANVAALGEALHGAGKNTDSLFYVTMGSGVGGGVVQNGRIYHGAKPGESEIGHLLLDKSGKILEESCSGWAVDRKIRAVVTENKSSVFAGLIGKTNGNEARFMKDALEQKDFAAATILNETAEDLAFGLSHAVHLFHPDIVVLGGGLSLIGESLRTAVARHLDRFVMKAFSPRPKVELSLLGEDAVPMGALSLAAHGRTGIPI